MAIATKQSNHVLHCLEEIGSVELAEAVARWTREAAELRFVVDPRLTIKTNGIRLTLTIAPANDDEDEQPPLLRRGSLTLDASDFNFGEDGNG